MICIYELVCPVSGHVRYIGKTSKPLSIRLSQHVSEAKRRVPNIGRRGDWIRSLLNQGMRPIIRLVIELPDGADWQKVECELIAHHRSLGANIINDTDGGDGMSNPTSEWRAAQAERLRGRKQSQETVAKRSAALKGIPLSPEWAAAISLGRINGKKRPTLTEEHKAKIGAASRARKRPPRTEEEKAKISASLRRRQRPDDKGDMPI